jgi:sec-independent protein translocase protein TatB
MFPEGRIFDFVIIGVLALIVVGPKDLPVLMRRLGRFVAHMRSMAAEFRASFDEMARQSELDELRKEVDALRTGKIVQNAMGLGDDSGVQTVIEDIHAGLKPGEVQLHPEMTPMPPQEIGTVLPSEESAEPMLPFPVATATPEPAEAAPPQPAPLPEARTEGGLPPVRAAL